MAVSHVRQFAPWSAGSARRSALSGLAGSPQARGSLGSLARFLAAGGSRPVDRSASFGFPSAHDQRSIAWPRCPATICKAARRGRWSGDRSHSNATRPGCRSQHSGGWALGSATGGVGPGHDRPLTPWIRRGKPACRRFLQQHASPLSCVGPRSPPPAQRCRRGAAEIDLTFFSCVLTKINRREKTGAGRGRQLCSPPSGGDQLSPKSGQIAQPARGMETAWLRTENGIRYATLPQ